MINISIQRILTPHTAIPAHSLRVSCMGGTENALSTNIAYGELYGGLPPHIAYVRCMGGHTKNIADFFWSTHTAYVKNFYLRLSTDSLSFSHQHLHQTNITIIIIFVVVSVVGF